MRYAARQQLDDLLVEYNRAPAAHVQAGFVDAAVPVQLPVMPMNSMLNALVCSSFSILYPSSLRQTTWSFYSSTSNSRSYFLSSCVTGLTVEVTVLFV